MGAHLCVVAAEGQDRHGCKHDAQEGEYAYEDEVVPFLDVTLFDEVPDCIYLKFKTVVPVKFYIFETFPYLPYGVVWITDDFNNKRIVPEVISYHDSGKVF